MIYPLIKNMDNIQSTKINSIENLLNIEKNKNNDNNTIKLIIGTFSSDLTPEEKNYLNEKFLNDKKSQFITEETSNKRRRLNS
jgi:hypothetical protein